MPDGAGGYTCALKPHANSSQSRLHMSHVDRQGEIMKLRSRSLPRSINAADYGVKGSLRPVDDHHNKARANSLSTVKAPLWPPLSICVDGRSFRPQPLEFFIPNIEMVYQISQSTRAHLSSQTGKGGTLKSLSVPRAWKRSKPLKRRGHLAPGEPAGGLLARQIMFEPRGPDGGSDEFPTNSSTPARSPPRPAPSLPSCRARTATARLDKLRRHTARRPPGNRVHRSGN